MSATRCRPSDLRRPARLSRRASLARRVGFSLVELMVVISIMAALAAISAPVLQQLQGGTSITDAAIQLQSSLASAREQARSRNEPRGVRLIADDTEPELVRTLMYIRQSDPLRSGKATFVYNPASPPSPSQPIQVQLPTTSTFLNPSSNTATTSEVGSLISNQLRRLPTVNNRLRGGIRFNDSSCYYWFDCDVPSVNQTIPPTLTLLQYPHNPLVPSTLYETLQGASSASQYSYTSFNKEQKTTTEQKRKSSTYEIYLGPTAAENVDLVTLPRGMVIDLGQLPTNSSIAPDSSLNRLSRIERDELSRQFDIMFSPSGRLIGSASRDTQVILWLRDENTTQAELVNGRKEILTGQDGQHMLIAIFSRSGTIQVSQPHFEDLNPNDGYYDFSRYYDNVSQGLGTGL